MHIYAELRLIIQAFCMDLYKILYKLKFYVTIFLYAFKLRHRNRSKEVFYVEILNKTATSFAFNIMDNVYANIFPYALCTWQPLRW